MFNAAKDAMASKGVQMYLNKTIARYGRIEDLKIDSRAKTMTVVCLLQGESTPIVVGVDRYVVEESAGKKFLRLAECRCNRPWVQSLLVDFVQGQTVEVPSWAAGAL